MRLYHGSYCRITDIDLSKCRAFKDFGRGFYLTPDFGRAVTMANRSVVLNHSGSPEVNILPKNLKILASRLKYHGHYIQYCFCTEKAIENLIHD